MTTAFIRSYSFVPSQPRGDIGEGGSFSIEEEASLLSSYHHVQHSASAIQFKVR